MVCRKLKVWGIFIMPHPGLFPILQWRGDGYFVSCGERRDEGVRETGRGRRRAKKALTFGRFGGVQCFYHCKIYYYSQIVLADIDCLHCGKIKNKLLR